MGRGSKIEDIIKSGDMKEKGVKSQETWVVLFMDVPISARFPVVAIQLAKTIAVATLVS